MCVCVGRGGGVKEKKWGRVVGISMCYIVYIFCKFAKLQSFGVNKKS